MPDAHRLRRLRLVVDLPDAGSAFALRTRAEALARSAFPAALARTFDRLVPADTHLRLDRFVLDLGRFSPETFERDAPAALEQALADALAEALAHARRSPESAARERTGAEARLERFEAYLATGAVPFRTPGEPFEPSAELRALIAEAPTQLAAALRGLSKSRDALERLVVQAGEDALRELLGALAPAGAAVVLAKMAEVIAAVRAAPAPPLDEAPLRRLLWLTTYEYLFEEAGAAFNGARYREFLLEGVAAETAVAYEELISLLVDAPAEARRTGAEPAAPAPLAPDPLAQIERYLTTGAPRGAGRELPALLRQAPGALAAIIRRVGREQPDRAAVVAERLLEWLQPDELLACLEAGETEGEPGVFADGTPSHIWAALILGERPSVGEAEGPVGKQLDRLAALVHWLDHGAPPWWASPTFAWPDLLAELADRPVAELERLFLAGDRERDSLRLRRATANMAAGDAERLLRRLPEELRESGASPELRSVGQRGGGGREAFTQGVAMPEGSRTLAGRGGPSAPATTPAPAPRGEIDRASLWAWLDGGDADGADTSALIRFLAELADARDGTLKAHFMTGVRTPATRARWVLLLPDEILARIVEALQPAHARVLVDATLVVGAARRRSLPTPAREGAEAPWLELLAMLAEPRPLDAASIVRGLVDNLARGDPARAASLAARAEALAANDGYRSVAAALRRVSGNAEPRARRQGHPPSRVRRPAPPLPEIGQTLYVGNAGLVLFAPFLPLFFSRLGVLTETEDAPKIIGGEARSRAVHLLQHLVDERCDRPEPDLVLNKLICGFHPADPIAPSIDPSEADRQICSDLVQAVLTNWPSLGGTSPAGLRETFLQRQGRLTREESRWTLKIQRKTVDILMETIPWSYRIVFHRWMTDPLHVDW